MQKSLISIFLIYFIVISKQLIFDFSSDTDISSWRVIDDVVMGGESSGNFIINTEGNAVFYGKVSLENNGGFSSVRHQFSQKSINSATKIKVRLKGDGKAYQFRIKDKNESYFSYITTFQTTGEWQTIDIKLTDLYPSYRGCLLYTSPSPRDRTRSRMPSSA